MANSTDASIISSTSAFDRLSASSADQGHTSDTDIADAVAGMDSESKMTVYLAHAELAQRARTGSTPVTPRSSIPVKKPVADKSYTEALSTRGRTSRPSSGKTSRNASVGAGSQTKRVLDRAENSIVKRPLSETTKNRQSEMDKMREQMQRMSEESAQKDQQIEQAESAWEHAEAQRKYEVERIQSVAAHVSEKAKDAKQQAKQATEEREQMKSEAERLWVLLGQMKEESHQRQDRFEAFKTAAEAEFNEQQAKRECAELDASNAKRELTDLAQQNQQLQAMMQQMASEYQVAITSANTEDQTVASLRHFAEQYYQQFQECGEKLLKLEEHCRSQQAIIQQHENVIQDREQAYKNLYAQSEAMHQQLIHHQSQLKEQETVASVHMKTVQVMQSKALDNDKDVTLAIENLTRRDQQIVELQNQIRVLRNQADEDRKTILTLRAEMQRLQAMPQHPDQDLITQMKQHSGELLERAMKMKENYEAKLAVKEEIIAEHAKRFRLMSDQQQSATQENYDLNESMAEMKETMDAMAKKIRDLESKQKPKDNPIMASLYEAAGRVFNDTEAVKPKPPAPARITPLTFNIARTPDEGSDGKSDAEEDDQVSPVFIATPKVATGIKATDAKGIVTAIEENMNMQKNTKVPKLPTTKLTANNVSDWLNSYGRNCAEATPYSDWLEIGWLREVLTAKEVWDLLDPGPKRHHKLDQVMVTSLRPMLTHRQLMEVEKMDHECCEKHLRPMGGRMILYIIIKGIKLDSDEDWSHAWEMIQTVTFEGKTHADIAEYYYKWHSMNKGVGTHVPLTMRQKHLEKSFIGKPLLENDLAHYTRQKDNFQNGLPKEEWKNYNIEFLEMCLHRSVLVMNKTDADEAYAHMWDTKTGRKRNQRGGEPAAPAKDAPPPKATPPGPGDGKPGKGAGKRGGGGGGGGGGNPPNANQHPPPREQPPPKPDPHAKQRGKGVNRTADDLSKICFFFNQGTCKFDATNCTKDHILVTKDELPLMVPPSRTGRSKSPKAPAGKGKIIDKGSIEDPANKGQKIDWVVWDNSKRPDGKKHVPDLCGTFLKTGKCEWLTKEKCERPHIPKEEKERRQKILDEHKW